MKQSGQHECAPVFLSPSVNSPQGWLHSSIFHPASMSPEPLWNNTESVSPMKYIYTALTFLFLALSFFSLSYFRCESSNRKKKKWINLARIKRFPPTSEIEMNINSWGLPGANLPLRVCFSPCRWSCGTSTRWPVSHPWCLWTRPRARWCVGTDCWWSGMIPKVRIEQGMVRSSPYWLLGVVYWLPTSHFWYLYMTVNSTTKHQLVLLQPDEWTTHWVS